MKLNNVRFLSALTALALFGVSDLRAQSQNTVPANVAGGTVPANIAGGFAKFTPVSQISSLAKAANGAMTNTTATFPMPPIAGHPVVAVLALSPAIFPQGIFFFPIDPQSQPAKAGDFALEGGVSVSYPQDGIALSFTDFRVDILGNLFARITFNGQSIGGEIQLANASAARIGLSPDKTQFTIIETLRVSNIFAESINKIFGATVLTPNQQIANVDLVADVID